MRLFNPLNRLAFKVAFGIGVLTILCKFSMSLPLLALIPIGCLMIFRRKIGAAFGIYLVISLSNFMNPLLMPKIGLVGNGVRMGFFLMSILLTCSGAGRSSRRGLPFGVMIFYLIVAAISSINGWAPSVSYLKLLFFTVFLFSIWFGARNFLGRPQEISIFRAWLLGVALFIVFGSLATLPFPSICYYTGLKHVANYGADYDVELANEIYRSITEDKSGLALFSGVMNHSQALAPTLASIAAWTLCDMLFIERKFNVPHLAVVLLSVPMLYMTRSRLALLLILVTGTLVFFYLLQAIRIPERIRSKATGAMIIGIFTFIGLAVYLEIKNETMTRWLRKTENVGGDTRSMREAVTETRQGAWEMMRDDFRRNPALGMGFQVTALTREMVKYSRGIIFSAPIEKGLLPAVIIGETGVVGAVVFTVFLVSFYGMCSVRRLRTTVTLFTVLVATNFGEATFFSPGNTGGFVWIVCLLGGYVIDLSVLDGDRMWMRQQEFGYGANHL